MDSLSTYKQNEITIASDHSSIQPSGDGSVIYCQAKYDSQIRFAEFSKNATSLADQYFYRVYNISMIPFNSSPIFRSKVHLARIPPYKMTLEIFLHQVSH